MFDASSPVGSPLTLQNAENRENDRDLLRTCVLVLEATCFTVEFTVHADIFDKMVSFANIDQKRYSLECCDFLRENRKWADVWQKW
jgi:hypothetical protein